MKILTLPVGQLQTNCYLLIDEKTEKVLIIDPGDDADYIQRIISDHSCTPIKIIATHGHFDHIMAITELKLAYNIPFLINKKDEFLVKNVQSSAKHFLGIQPDPPPTIDKYLAKTVTFGNEKLEVIETPGHTPGSICLYHKKSNSLFTGDLLFSQGSVGRTDFSYSNTNHLQESLKNIFSLPLSIAIYPGHGNPSTLKEEVKFHKY